MNKWFAFLGLLCLGLTPIYDKHEKMEQITEEIKNIEVIVQDKQFRFIETSTPTLVELEDKEIIVISTNGIQGLLYRNGIDLFLLSGSCVTVKRGD